MNIPFDYYKTFYYVVQQGSFSKAAVVLRTGQPNVTRTIRLLEAQLSCTLFVRSPRGVRLTVAGEGLYAHIAVAVEHILAGETALAQQQTLHSGAVTIASSEIALRCCLLPVLERYRALYPHVRIRLSNFSTPQAIDAVRNHLADFAVVTAPEVAPHSLLQRQIAQVQQVLIGGEAYRALAQRILSAQEIAALPLICMNAQTASGRLLTRAFAQHGVTLAPEIEVATADQILPLVRGNLGIGFVPQGFLAAEDGIVRLHPEHPLSPQTISLLRRRDAPLSVAAQALEQLLLPE